MLVKRRPDQLNGESGAFIIQIMVASILYNRPINNCDTAMRHVPKIAAWRSDETGANLG